MLCHLSQQLRACFLSVEVSSALFYLMNVLHFVTYTFALLE